MSEAKRLIDGLSRVVNGEAWYGDSIETILTGVTATAAVKRAAPGTHTIWELLRHMTAWTGEVQRRLTGYPAGNPQEGDWPATDGGDEERWQRDVAAFLAAHQRLIDTVASYSDAELLEPTRDTRNRSAGAGVGKDVLLQGLAQHHVYHAGQIALLKKLL
jgi:uncharacterized damage-inducible protein DinB